MGKDSHDESLLKEIAGTALAASVPQSLRQLIMKDKEELDLSNYYSANDNINVALIGAGGHGNR